MIERLRLSLSRLLRRTAPGNANQAGHDPVSSGLNQHLNSVSEKLSVAAVSITQVADQHALSAAEQIELIDRTSTLLSDFLELSQRIQEQARSLNQIARQSAETSQTGQAVIGQAILGMNQLRAQVSTISTTILALAQLTRRIDDIITSVSEIAIQSNLLALNASIEAARAGVHGRGFAVVADEVRSLSQQSTQAAKQVRAILAEIQSAMKETVGATESGLKGVDEGVTMTQQADSVMGQLSQSVSASQKAVSQVQEAITRQADGLEEISIAMERLYRIAQRNSDSVRTVESVSDDLSQLALDLQQIVVSTGVQQNTDDNRKQYAGNANGNAQQYRAS